MEEEKKDKVSINKETILGILAVAIVAIVGFSVIFTKTSSSENEEKNNYKPNDVKTDKLFLSFLKLEDKEENIVYSSLSIKYALSMLNEGANGKTKEEIQNVLGNNGITKYENIDKVLSLANSVFIKDTYKEYVLEKYISTLKDKFNAEFFYDKFENATNINKWIEEKTFNIIKNMLKDEDVKKPNLEMILVNALAIDMDWYEKFDAANTSSRPFTKANGEEMKVAMMHKSIDSKAYKYFQDENYSVISMPLEKYGNTQLEFIAILPTNESLHTFVTSDSFDDTVTSLLEKLHTVNGEELSLNIPRFKYEFKLNLNEDLNTLGIKEAFSDVSADFSNMSSSELYVGSVLHKANIEFNEKGIKAAAATVIMMFDKSAMPEEKDIVYLNYDKPFMYIIRDSETNEIWFTGAVYEPLSWDDVKDEYKYE